MGPRLRYSVVSIGIFHHAKPEVAVIYDPYRDEMFCASRGNGAFLNGARIGVDTASSFGEALMASATWRLGHHELDMCPTHLLPTRL